MLTREIPRDEWAEFFDELSGQEMGPVTIEVIGPDVGDQVPVRDMPLMGVTLLEKGSDQGEIEIMTGDSPDAHHSYTIGAPTHVWVEETEEGEPRALEIEAADQPKTLVHFRPFAETSVMEGTVGLEDETDSPYQP